jgi:hypothetical protein
VEGKVFYFARVAMKTGTATGAFGCARAADGVRSTRVRRHLKFVGVIYRIDQMHIDYPEGEFTVVELERVNPEVPSEVVVSKLAAAIFDRSVEFVSGWGRNSVTYRKKESS